MRTLRALALSALAILAVSAQTPAPPPPAPQTPQALPNPALRNRLFMLKNRPASAVGNVLGSLRSGLPGTSMDVSDRDGVGLITVRDLPENLAVIEDAIKRLDVPISRRDVELTIQVLFASRQEQGAGLPEALKPVAAALRRTLAYTGFVRAGSFLIRTTDNAEWIHGEGELEDPSAAPDRSEGARISSKWSISGLQLAEPKEGPRQIHLRHLEFQCNDGGTRGIHVDMTTDVDMKDGETVVVGTSFLKSRAVILVLTARVLD